MSIPVICIILRHAEWAKFQIMQKFIWKLLFFHKLSARNLWKSRKLRWKIECNQRFLFCRLARIRMPYMGYKAREVWRSNTCPLKNLDFQKFSPETRWRKFFGSRKFRLRWITTLPVQLSNMQTDPTNAFVRKLRKCLKLFWASKLRNAVGHG